MIVAGANGVFGRLLVLELAGRFDVVGATRRDLDLDDVDAVGRAAQGAYAFACTAGPFQRLDRRIVRAVVESGAHWVDIADDPAWFFGLVDDRALDTLAHEHGVGVVPGLSSVPAISCALVRRLHPVDKVDIILRINNRNLKGVAAIASSMYSRGGAFDTPDRELLRRELGVEADVHVKFEAPFASALIKTLRIVPERHRVKVSRFMSRLAKPFNRFGSSGGGVEVRAGDKSARVNGRDQRFAILPAVFALEHLEGISGCLSPTHAFHPEELLRFVEAHARSGKSENRGHDTSGRVPPTTARTTASVGDERGRE